MAEKKKVLVTGANGQLGMELRDLSATQSAFEFVFVTREELPVDNFAQLRDYFKINPFNYCINCAAYTKVDAAETNKEEAYLVNAEAVSVIADLCKQYNIQLIHISTDYVFDGNGDQPYREDAATDPINYYGASKLDGEHYATEKNPETIIIRTSWVYSSYGNNFVKTMVKLMTEKPEINVVTDQTGSPTYAGDLAECVLDILSNLESGLTEASGIYNFSNAGNITWYDFAIEIKFLIGSECRINPIPTSGYPTPAKRPKYSVLDKAKIQHTFGIKLKPWKESLAVCLHKLSLKK
jgi:dTDP-4-dehydrorhamnose reductase